MGESVRGWMLVAAALLMVAAALIYYITVTMLSEFQFGVCRVEPESPLCDPAWGRYYRGVVLLYALTAIVWGLYAMVEQDSRY